MPISNPKRTPVRMPDDRRQPDPLGIRWHGPVLSGRQSVQEAFERVARATTSRSPQTPSVLEGIGLDIRPGPPPSSLPLRPSNATVLVDPAEACRRYYIGNPTATHYTHPDQYDPVLRFHLRLDDPPKK